MSTGTAPAKKDISAEEGTTIAIEAATWKGTPYSLNGQASAKGIGGDCSGITYRIYSAAHFPYPYLSSGTFRTDAVTNGLFRELAPTEAKQDGDILSWPNHMAIYSTFAKDLDNATTARVTKSGSPWTQRNDMWTASHPGGPGFAAAEMRWWRSDAPKVFRYQK